MFPDKPGGFSLYANESWRRYFVYRRSVQDRAPVHLRDDTPTERVEPAGAPLQ